VEEEVKKKPTMKVLKVDEKDEKAKKMLFEEK